MTLTRIPEEYCFRIRRAIEGKMVTVIEKHRFPENVTIDGRETNATSKSVPGVKSMESKAVNQFQERPAEQRESSGQFDPTALPKIQIRSDRLLRNCICDRKNGLQDDCYRFQCGEGAGGEEAAYPRRKEAAPARQESEAKVGSRGARPPGPRASATRARPGPRRSSLEVLAPSSSRMISGDFQTEKSTRALERARSRHQGQGDCPALRNSLPSTFENDTEVEKVKIEDLTVHRDNPSPPEFGIFSDRLVLCCNCNRINGLQDFCAERICKNRPTQITPPKLTNKVVPPYFYTIPSEEKEIQGHEERTAKQTLVNEQVAQENNEDTMAKAVSEDVDIPDIPEEFQKEPSKIESMDIERTGLVEACRNEPHVIKLKKCLSQPNLLETKEKTSCEDRRNAKGLKTELPEQCVEPEAAFCEDLLQEDTTDQLVPENYCKIYVPREWLAKKEEPVVVDSSLGGS